MPGQRNFWIIGLSVAGGTLLSCAIAVLVALFGLGQIGSHTDLTALPAWLWYYRADPLLILWLKRGALAGAVVVGLLAIGILRRGPALHGTARFAREGEIRREGLRAAAGIVVGRKAGRFLIFGGSEHVLLEAPRLGKASVIASGFSYVAGYGLRLVPVIQSRSQLRAIYGPDVTDEIIANCGLEVVFTPKELKVANELSERLGFFTMNVKSRSRTIHGLLANRSISESDQRRALLLPQELMQLPKNELLLLRAGIPPIRGRKIAYYRMPRFTRRVVAPPVLSARPIAAMLSAPAPVSEQRGAGTPGVSGAPQQPATSSGGTIQEEIAMREMTDAELAGASEITDDMLVLGDLAELPPPGDEAAAIAFVSAMIERALLPPVGQPSTSIIQERTAHVR